MAVASMITACDGERRASAPTLFGADVSETPQTGKVTAQVPVNPDDVLLVANDVRITIQDYEFFLKVQAFGGAKLTKRALANPRFQRDTLHRCYQLAFMRDFLRRSGATVKPAQTQAAIAQALERFGVQTHEALAEKLSEFVPVEAPMIESIAEASVVALAVQEHLVSSMDEATARTTFEKDHRVMTLEIARFDNTPLPEEALALMKQEEQAFNAYVSAHPEYVMAPPKAQFVRFRVPQASQTEDLMAALKPGNAEAISACSANAACQVLNDLEHLHGLERTEDTAWAFRIPVGAVHQPVADELWVLHEVLPPQKRAMHDDAVATEVAQRVMRDTRPAPKLIASLKSTLESNPDAFSAITASLGGTFQTYENVRFIDLNHQTPALDARVLAILDDLKDEEIGAFSSPILTNGDLIVFRVRACTKPTPQDFAREQAAWRAQCASDRSLKRVQRWLQDTLPTMTSTHMRRIQQAYGTLQLDGSIR